MFNVHICKFLATVKLQYYNDKINKCKRNQKTVFSVGNELLHLNQAVISEMVKSNKNMAHGFNNFFHPVKDSHSTVYFRNHPFQKLHVPQGDTFR